MTGIRAGKGKPQSEQFIEEGLRKINGQETPIIQLYRLVQSEEYVKHATAGGMQYIDVAYVDLIGAAAGS